MDLRLRSITLCAVFLAIFLPAALVELGCFLVVAGTFKPDFPLFTEPLVPEDNDGLALSNKGCDLGVI